MLTALLGRIAGPLAIKVLTALGVGIVSYAGFSTLIDQVTAHIISNMNGIEPAYLQIITLFGIPESVSITLGAFTTAATVMTLKKFKIL